MRVDPDTAWAGEFPVDTVVPDEPEPAEVADDDAPAAEARPGLGPGTYDPDGLTPSGQDDAGAPSDPPTVPPTWSDPEGAAIADAAEEQASLPADPGETRLAGHEIVTHDAPVETGVPDAPIAGQAASSVSADMAPLPVRRPVRRPPVGRPSQLTAAPHAGECAGGHSGGPGRAGGRSGERRDSPAAEDAEDVAPVAVAMEAVRARPLPPRMRRTWPLSLRTG